MRRLTVGLSALALVLAACAGSTDPEVDGAASVEPADEAPDEGTAEDGAGDGLDEGDDEPEAGSHDAGSDDAGSGDAGSGDDGEGQEDAGTDGDPEAAPTPDPAELDDPCADHLERDGEAFLELVSPVDDQRTSGEVELVGCSSVYEGTVQYRVLDGDGRTLDEGFTTAECGGPCIGAFRETIDLDAAAGEPVAYIQVFWEDAADGSDRDLVERIVIIG